MGRSTGFNAAQEEDDDLPWYVVGAARKAALAARKSKETGRALPVVEREMPGAQFLKNKTRRAAPVMGSDKNIPKQTITESKTTPGITPKLRTPPRQDPRRPNGLIMPTQEELDALSGRPGQTVQYDSGTLNPSEFGPATMGPAGRAQPVMTSMENVDVDRIGRGGFEAPDVPERVRFEDETAKPFYSRFKKGGQVKKKPAKKMSKGGSVSSASKRADGCAQRGKTKGRMV